MNILHRKRRRRAEINIVPLVDVLTSLIFFFLLTMQFKEIYAVDITPPSMKSSESVSKNKPATVSVTKDGKFFWNSDEISESSLEAKIKDLSNEGHNEIVFVIGGANGLSKEVSMRADYKLSFSKMTFTHQLIRIFLYEQIYRAFKIIHNENYHR